MQEPWHSMSTDEVCSQLVTNAGDGLSQSERKSRAEKYGKNKLQETKKISPLQIFIGQFQDLMVIILLAATAIAGFMGETVDAITILAIIIINAILGFMQEYRAEKSLEALKKLSAPIAKVICDGSEAEIPAVDLVPGDIILLEAGDKIPADIRLIKTSSLEVEESTLTGESVPVGKDANHICKSDTSLGDRKNAAYMGTTVTLGRGTGVVTGIGMQTEMGKIAGMIQDIDDEQTPLQQHLSQLGKWLVGVCIFLCALVVAVGVWRGERIGDMLLAGISLAVAAIPEGLPAVVTIALAIGVQKMVKRNAIVRKLPSVETLGCATVICSDKTGTITQNQMTVQRIFVNNNLIRVTGTGYEPKGEFFLEKDRVDPKNDFHLSLALRIGMLCNHATLQKAKGLLRRRKNHDGGWETLGDPTEIALVSAAAKAGFWRKNLESDFTEIGELPFDSQRKCMSMIFRSNSGEKLAYVKGAVDVLLSACQKIYLGNEEKVLTEKQRQRIIQANLEFASGALRVLALAYKRLPDNLNEFSQENIETDLVFVGLVGLLDPPRPEVKKAIQTCMQAGIRPIMITGDHLITAEAVAKEIGLITEAWQAIEGRQIEAMSDAELEETIGKVSVYARVSPNHKLRIVRALKKAGQVVGMTGDGVNDAPAIKEADIGISMGKSGTDVTKEAASLVLADDNFATIVAAVEEGRAIYDNIRKFIRYLLSCNIGEIATMFLAIVAGLPIPLLPIQILWINLVTDGLPAVALGVEPPGKDNMKRPPRKPKDGIFAGGLNYQIFIQGIFIGIGTICAFVYSLYYKTGDLVVARTVGFTTLVMAQLFFVFACKVDGKSLLKINLFSNVFLLIAVAISFAMQLAAVYHPFFQKLFHTVNLNLDDWVIVFVSSIIPIIIASWFSGLQSSRTRKLRK